MKTVHYIIVGLGLAGLAFAEKALGQGKKVVVFDTKTNAASRVAAGLYNPVILKRYTLPYQAEEQLDLTTRFFKNLSEKLQIDATRPMPVWKILSSVEDQNNWFTASDKPGMGRFIKPQLMKPENGSIEAPFQLGEVQESGKVDIPELLDAYRIYLASEEILITENFDHSLIQFKDDAVIYKDIQAGHIVFAEGFGLKQNTFFNELPLVGNKGEYLIIEAAQLQLKTALKSGIFIVPLGKDRYKVGATFNWKDKNWENTQAARDEILAKLKKMINCEYKVVDQIAGIRPTTGDRRPLIGKHPKHKQLALLNGLGTRGTMMGPYLANLLFQHLENDGVLPPEVDVNRFASKMRD
ncbi:MAG: FAD-binding oxidoreductase [Leeuwenhoekiella sp.]